MTRRFLTLTLLAVLGCAKISDFTEPFIHEMFLCSMTVTPSVSGPYSGAAPVNGVSLVGDSTGRTVTIHGLPTNDPFPLVPKDLMDELKKYSSSFKIPPYVSGLTADVIDKRRVEVNGFIFSNNQAKDLQPEVTGTIVREGPRLATLNDAPIVIKVKVRPLRALIPAALWKEFETTTGVKLTEELSDEDMIQLYRFDLKCEVTSIF